MNTPDKSREVAGIIVFYFSIVFVLIGFFVDSYYGCLLFLFYIPIFYGTHEAIHNNLLFNTKYSKLRRKFNLLSGTIGGVFQLMNFLLIKKSHGQHHHHGRTENGYAPDIVNRKPVLFDYIIYFYSLLGGPAYTYQLGGFVLGVFSTKQLRFDFKFDLKENHERTLYFTIQFVVLFSVITIIVLGGWLKLLIYIISTNLIWGLLQNVAHYGIIGVDHATDRVCSKSYHLEKPFKMLTFGSTAHFAHHVNQHIPSLFLYDEIVLEKIESRLGIKVQIKHGLFEFIKDVLAQFKGPIYYTKLDASWIADLPQQQTKSVSFNFGYRKGRHWLRHTEISYEKENNTNSAILDETNFTNSKEY